MGGNNSKSKTKKSHEDEYMLMLKRKRQRADEQAERESKMRGKAYQELKNQEHMREVKRSTSALASKKEQQLMQQRKLQINNLSGWLDPGQKLYHNFMDPSQEQNGDGLQRNSKNKKKLLKLTCKAKSPMEKRLSDPTQDKRDKRRSTNLAALELDDEQKQTTAPPPSSSRSKSTGIAQINDKTEKSKSSNKDKDRQKSLAAEQDRQRKHQRRSVKSSSKQQVVKRVVDSDNEDAEHKASLINGALLNDHNLEWVAALLNDLEQMDNNSCSIYKDQLKSQIDKMLGSFTINMDPCNTRRLYRDKAFKETLNLPNFQLGNSTNTCTSPNNHQSSRLIMPTQSPNAAARSSTGIKRNNSFKLQIQKIDQANNGLEIHNRPTTPTSKQIQDMAMPAKSSFIQEILTDPAFQRSTTMGHQHSNSSSTSIRNHQSVQIFSHETQKSPSHWQRTKLSQSPHFRTKLDNSTTSNTHEAFSYANQQNFSVIDDHYLQVFDDTKTEEKQSSEAQLRSILAASATAVAANNSNSVSSISCNTTTKKRAVSSNGPSNNTTMMQQQNNLTNEEKMLKEFEEHDIVGLSIFGASSQSKYSMKMNTLRTHLVSMDDHPIVRIKDFFRDVLEQYVKKQTKAISENISFYAKSQDASELATQYQKLFEKIQREIKSFVTLMHDAVVRFYIFDFKVGMQYKQNEHLTNLLTSLVLKNPIYNEIHAVMRYGQKPLLKQAMKTVYQIRIKYAKNLEEKLNIDPINIGQTLYQKQQKQLLNSLKGSENHESSSQFKSIRESLKEDEIDSGSNTSSCQNCTDLQSLQLFSKLLRKFEHVRNVSSPILKLIIIHRVMNDVMAAFNGSVANFGPHEADNLIVNIFYILVRLQTRGDTFLGARFLEECTYIDSFLHEDQIDLIQEYTNVEHIKVVISSLQKGIKECERLFICPKSDSFDGSSRSSSSVLSKPLTENVVDISACMQDVSQNFDLKANKNSCIGTPAESDRATSSIIGGLHKSQSSNSSQPWSYTESQGGKASPLASDQFPSLKNQKDKTNQSSSLIEQEAEKEAKQTSAGLSVLQKLQGEGLFSFKNVPDKKKTTQPKLVKAKSQFVLKSHSRQKQIAIVETDAAYSKLFKESSFLEVPQQQISPLQNKIMKQKSFNSFASTNNSEDTIIASKTTKGSTVMSTVMSTAMSSRKSESSIFQNNHKSSLSPKSPQDESSSSNSYQLSSPGAVPQRKISLKLSPANRASELHHLPVIQEDVQVEEGQDQDFEIQRMTLQKLRNPTNVE